MSEIGLTWLLMLAKDFVILGSILTIAGVALQIYGRHIDFAERFALPGPTMMIPGLVVLAVLSLPLFILESSHDDDA